MTPGHGSGTPSFKYRYFGLAVAQANVLSGETFVPGLAFGYDQQRSLTAVGKYNAAGTQVSNTVCLVHDAMGRLTAVGLAKAVMTGPGAIVCQSEAEIEKATGWVRFDYDALNRRVARQDGSAWVEYLHDSAGNLLAEVARPATAGGAWSTKREYVWLEGRPLAQLEYPGPAARTDGYTYFFHLDHLGQPRALTGESGATVWNAVTARPYGDIAESPGVDPLNGRTVVTNLRLPGQYDERLLGGTGLQGPYYNWNRWYLPSMGRYMELDPIAMTGDFNSDYGPNWYGYAEGSPLRFTDRLGLDAEMCYRKLNIFIMPYARHCYVRFNGNDKDTMSFDPTGVGPDSGYRFLSKTCTKTTGSQNDTCVKREMKRCQADQYDFTGFNCCHCVEQALNACGQSIPVSSWPNWPVNPGPQPGEPGSCQGGPAASGCGGKK